MESGFLISEIDCVYLRCLCWKDEKEGVVGAAFELVRGGGSGPANCFDLRRVLRSA